MMDLAGRGIGLVSEEMICDNPSFLGKRQLMTVFDNLCRPLEENACSTVLQQVSYERFVERCGILNDLLVLGAAEYI